MSLAALCEFEDHYEMTLEVKHYIENHVDAKGDTWYVDLSLRM